MGRSRREDDGTQLHPYAGRTPDAVAERRRSYREQRRGEDVSPIASRDSFLPIKADIGSRHGDVTDEDLRAGR